MQIQNGSQSFPQLSGSGPQLATATVTFPSVVSQATAILTGFIAEFTPRNNRPFGQLDVQVTVPPGGVVGNEVTVNLTFGLRDWSEEWDDPYDGQIFFSVIAE